MQNSCGHDTGGICVIRKVGPDDHSTTHVHVLSRVVSRLARISVSLGIDFLVKQ